MRRWVYWVSLAAIAVIVAVPVATLLTDPLADFSTVFKQGIDLQGGTSLIYLLRPPEGGTKPDAGEARKIILERIDPTGVRGYTVRQIGADRLEIVIPGRQARLKFDTGPALTAEAVAQQAQAEKVSPDALKRFEGGTPLLVRMKPAIYIRDIERRIAGTVRGRLFEDPSFHVVGMDLVGDPNKQEYEKVAVWLAVKPADKAASGAWKAAIESGLATNPDVEDVKRLVGQTGFLEFRIVADRDKDRDKVPDGDFDHLVNLKKAGRPPDNPRFRWYRTADSYYKQYLKHSLAREWVYVADDQAKVLELLIDVGDGQNITGKDLASAYRDSKSDGEPIVSFRMKTNAQERLAILTKPENKGRYLAIILDGTVQSAPVLMAQLSSGGIIEGYRTRQRERDEVVTVLSSGQLAASLGDPIFERTLGPELGEDNKTRGFQASVVALVLVLAFMGVYYRFAGLVADVALLLNIVLLVSVMYVVDQAWTLPGIAGLVLTVGMSVDANVLIFERLREEKGHGGSLAFALKRAYSRAFTTIFDSNLTTLIPAVFLLLLATEEVQGFAIVIIVGIVSSMFTAIVITRMIFETGMKAGLIKDLKMFQLFKAPNIDWMRLAKIAVIVSGILVLAGATMFFARGKSKYDIEFTGGTQVDLALRVPGRTEADRINAVRDRVAAAFGPNAVVQGLDVEKRAGEENLEYFLVSVSSVGPGGEEVGGEQQVSQKLRTVFADMWPTTGQGVSIEAQAAPITVDLIRDRLRGLRGAGTEPPAPGTRAPPAEEAYDYIPDEYRQYIGKLRIEATLSVPVTLQDLRGELDRFLREKHPDLVDTKIRIDGTTLAKEADQFTGFDIWIAEDYDGSRVNTPNPTFWKGVLQGAVGKREFLSITNFEATMAGETWQKAIMTIVFSFGAIVLYMWVRFSRAYYGVAGVLALVHDVFITLGAVALTAFINRLWTGNWLLITDLKINLPMVGGFLTLIGYSINDTIVVFDRIRENRGKFGDLSVEVVNRSINQTLSRTIWTSFTTFIVVAVLYVLGGTASTLHGFAFVMSLGVVVGTYSSIAVAAPILVLRNYLMRAYAVAFPILSVLLTGAYVIYHGFALPAVGWVIVLLWLGWLAAAASGTWAFANARPWGLLVRAAWSAKAVAAVGFFAPLVLVVMLVVIRFQPPEADWIGWAGPIAVGSLLAIPAVLALYHGVWGSLFRKD